MVRASQKALHSNLVIFKYSNYNLYVIAPCSFTFQSGYIQIKGEPCTGDNLVTLHSNLVIFKLFTKQGTLKAEYLYIPIWLYSNVGTGATGDNQTSPLHSNLVIFK